MKLYYIKIQPLFVILAENVFLRDLQYDKGFSNRQFSVNWKNLYLKEVIYKTKVVVRRHNFKHRSRHGEKMKFRKPAELKPFNRRQPRSQTSAVASNAGNIFQPEENIS